MWRTTFHLFLASLTLTGAIPCVKQFPDPSDQTTFMCVCTESSCDDIDDLGDNEGIALYTTSLDGDRLTKAAAFDSNQTADVTLTLDTTKTEQTIIGFGGAMTDSTVINLNSLTSDALRQLIIDGYFSQKGLRYNMIRLNIASCDFSIREYSYLESRGDFDLVNFTLVDEDTWKIGYVKQAMQSAIGGEPIKIFGSPWSAPGWMKSSGQMKGPGWLLEGERYSRTYAGYLSRFVEEYLAQGIPIWALTVQNEPSTGLRPNYPFQTMYFSPAMERDFLRDYLAPALFASKTAQFTQIIIHDFNRLELPFYADTILADQGARDLVVGIAVHWYDDIKGADPMLLTNTSLKHPDKFLLYTEGCIEGGSKPGVFAGGMRYAKNILEDLTHRVSGWVDWNMALDIQGGPNWVENYVDSPILIAPTNDAFYRQPMYYAMGHFSRFIARNAVRVSLNVSSTTLDAAAFLNPDKSLAIIIINDSPNLVQTGIGGHVVAIKPSSINTLFFKDESYLGSFSHHLSVVLSVLLVCVYKVL